MAAPPDPASPWLLPHAKGCTLSVRIHPNAKKSAILGSYGEGRQAALKIAMHAPPIEGRANEALLAFLAGLLSQPRSRIEILSGATVRSKVLLLTGIDVAEARQALSNPVT